MQLRPLVQMSLGLVLLSPLSAQTTVRASVGSGGIQGNSSSGEYTAISLDGACVAFHSWSSNLAPSDTNGRFDVFVHEPASGQTVLVSVNSSGTLGNDSSAYASISGDGRYVAFNSVATNLAPGDVNQASDVFVHDRVTGTTTLVSTDSQGVRGNHDSFQPSISADGRFVVFNSTATNLVQGDTNGVLDVFVRDRLSGTTVRVSVDSAGGQGNDSSYLPRISADGSTVTYYSYARNLVPGDWNGAHDVFVHELASGLTERVSIGASGAEPDQQSWTGSLSADGRFVTFNSVATNLIAGDTNSAADVFVKDRATGVVIRASVSSQGLPANSTCQDAFLSADGRYVGFTSWATNLVLGDTNSASDVFVHDLVTGDTVRASVDSAGVLGDGFSMKPCLSGDGRQIAYGSRAANLVSGDTNNQSDVFMRDRSPFSIGDNYCGPANLNSSGNPARISAFGDGTVSSNNLTLVATQLPLNVWGYFLNSDLQGFIPFPGGSSGNLCLGGGIGRHSNQVANSGAGGELMIHVDLTVLPRASGVHSVLAGETWNFQCWFRDFQSGPTSNFTDGIEIVFQ
ncbi:MAG: hypothetical protein ACI8QC_004023 [Planctomycetota bacterium]|jgi:hypothetical protein